MANDEPRGKAMIADGPHEGEVIEGPLPPVLQRLREIAQDDGAVRYVRESYRLQVARVPIVGPGDDDRRYGYTWVPSRGPGIYAEGQLILPAADAGELDEGLRLELVYERSRDAVVEVARAQIDRWRRGEQFETGLLDDAVAAHDQAKAAHLAHGGSVWTPGGEAGETGDIASYVRPPVLAFARLMEAVLREHDGDHPEGWKGAEPTHLAWALDDHIAKLIDRSLTRNGEPFLAAPAQVARDIADCLNYLMMIADVTGVLAGFARGEGEA